MIRDFLSGVLIKSSAPISDGDYADSMLLYLLSNKFRHNMLSQVYDTIPDRLGYCVIELLHTMTGKDSTR